VPIGVATAVLAWRLLEHEEGLGLRHGADVLGAALVTGSLMLGVYTIVEAGGNGWGSAQTLGQGAVALALMAFFLTRQAIAAEPLLPLRLFRSRNVSGANVILMLLVAGLFGMFFLGSLYLERVLGYEAIEIGLAFLPVSVGIGVLSLFVSPRLGLRFGARPVLLGGLTLIALSLLWMARLPVDGGYVVDLLPAMLLLGAGAGISFPQIMSLAMSAATPQDSGLLSGLINTTQQVGAAVGLAVLATLATERSEELLRDGATGPSALTSGYTLAFAIGAGFVIAAIAVAIVVLRSPAPPAEERRPAEEHRPSLEPAYREA
jgi:predicted MFS family arabinose efflux permease